ncbi:MAG: TauD/TfdA family dioxygenase [Burkholderiales bacterium]|nr:TauD/TfdA family dioxygenase [Burkholderiales bacterium]
MSAVMAGLKVVPTGKGVGAEISGGRLPDLDDAEFGLILDAYYKHSVLLLRGQNLSDPELLAVGRRFGELEPPGMSIIGKPYIDEYPDILVISNRVDENGMPMGNLGNGEATWHTDMSYREVPISTAILHALEIPEHGGGNMFYASMYDAYETLPKALKTRIEGRLCIHDETYNSAGQLRKGFKEVGDPRQAPGARHPLVRLHPVTRRKALFLGRRRNAYIVGLPLDESEQVLDELWAHATRHPVTWGEWGLGDILIWDNRCLLHMRAGFNSSDSSVLHRVQCKGEAVLAG